MSSTKPSPFLASVCEFIADCLHATAPTQETGFPLIRTPNIGKGMLLLDDVYRVSEPIYREWTRRAVPLDGDLILAREAPAGNVAIVRPGQTVCLGQRTVHLRPDKAQVDPQYLCYFLLAPKQQGLLLAGETGATAKHVNMKDIRRLPLDGLPPIDIQKKTAELIAKYDDLIENNRRRIALLEKAARLLYEEWFVRFRFPGHEHAKFINGLPVGWESKRLAEKAVAVMGQSPPSKFYNEVGVGLPFHQGVKDYGDRFPVHRVYCSQLARLAEPGDILFSVRAPVGRINISRDRIVIGRGLAALRARDGHQTMLFHQLRAHFYKEDMIGTGAIYAAVTKSGLFGVKLPSPPEPLVVDFEEIASVLDRQVEVLTSQNARLAESRDLLLPRLMSGEVEV